MELPEPPFARELDLLATGELGIVGRVLDSSNLTFVAEVTRGDAYAWAIYKPELGERPLHDFDPGLHARERAAFVVSEALGWGIVPPTIVRADGPAGIGSLQWYVENDGAHYFALLEQHPDTHDALRQLAVFDVVTNNTDRKGGHVLLDAAGRVWGIDHGLCFHAADKLRTVIWDFGAEPVPDVLLGDLAALVDDPPAELFELLDDLEVDRVLHRAARLLKRPVLPVPTSHYAFPWPLV